LDCGEEIEPAGGSIPTRELTILPGGIWRTSLFPEQRDGEDILLPDFFNFAPGSIAFFNLG